MKSSRPAPKSLEAQYRRRYDDVLVPLAAELEAHVRECLGEQPRIDRITARAKNVGSFVDKATSTEKGNPKYSDPMKQIQDQVGVRIVTFYRSDVDRLDPLIKKYFRPIEFKDHVPDSEWKFGYFGRHYVLVIPSDVIDNKWEKSLVPPFFELQIKTLFQHAWSEANHDLGYKPGKKPLAPPDERRLAFTSAQAWGADHIFDELFRTRRS